MRKSRSFIPAMVLGIFMVSCSKRDLPGPTHVEYFGWKLPIMTGFGPVMEGDSMVYRDQSRENPQVVKVEFLGPSAFSQKKPEEFFAEVGNRERSLGFSTSNAKLTISGDGAYRMVCETRLATGPELARIVTTTVIAKETAIVVRCFKHQSSLLPWQFNVLENIYAIRR